MTAPPATSTATFEPAPAPLPVTGPGGGDRESDAPTDLVGRRHERRTLEQLLTAVSTGRSEVLVVRGDAGVGKTALLGHLRGRASGCQVTSVTAARPERHLDYAGLHQLCWPLLDGIDRLPEPQRAALQTA